MALKLALLSVVSAALLGGCLYKPNDSEVNYCSSAYPQCPGGYTCQQSLGVCQAASSPPDMSIKPEQLKLDSLPNTGAIDAAVSDGPSGQCGNSKIEAGEDCEGDVGSATCASRGFGGGGTLQCVDCKYDTSDCLACSAPTPPLGLLPAIIVSSSLGDDDKAMGTCIAYKTITKALSKASAGSTIWVAPGTYDANNGEIFPLVVGSGLQLIGDEDNLGAAAGSDATTISGAGQVPGGNGLTATLMVSGNNTKISGLWFKQTQTIPSNTVGIQVTLNSPVLTSNTFSCSACVLSNPWEKGAINVVASATPKIRNNNFAGIKYGKAVAINESAIAELGTVNTPGNNQFNGQFAGTAIYYNTSASTISAVGNYWLDSPPCSQIEFAKNSGEVKYGSGGSDYCSP